MNDDADSEIKRLRALADRRGELAVERRREIERLRLTDEERVVLGNIANDAAYRALSHTERVVRGLLARLGGGK